MLFPGSGNNSLCHCSGTLVTAPNQDSFTMNMQDAGIMLAAFQFFCHMHDDQVSLTANKRPETVLLHRVRSNGWFSGKIE